MQYFNCDNQGMFVMEMRASPPGRQLLIFKVSVHKSVSFSGSRELKCMDILDLQLVVWSLAIPLGA